MTKELEVVVSESVQLGAVQVTSPEDIVNRASSVATVLAEVIDKKKLYAVINGKKYVQVDGWATLGAMLGVLPREARSEKIDNGYLAFVELVRTTDGMIIGGASAICTREEKNWKSRDEYAIKSMATTRATGKAYRLGFSWIMNLAGYESTPAEEMIDAEFSEKKAAPAKKKSESTSSAGWTSDQITAVIGEYPDMHGRNVVSMLNLSKKLSPETGIPVLLKWCRVYKEHRGNETPPDQSAGLADEATFK